MTKLQNEFAKTVDRLNDAYVYCQKELDRLREDNNNLRLDVMYYKTLLKKCHGLFCHSLVDGEEPNNKELITILTKIEEVLK